MNIKIATLLILIIGLFQSAFGQSEAVAPENQKGYLIGPGDVITVKVMGEPDFNVEAARVDEDGRIQVPFSDTGILAKCRTEKDLRADIVQHVSKFLRSPQISVYVKERNSRPPVTVYGEVKQQQQVDLRREAHLLELISFAGGVTDEAGGMIQVFRTRPPLCGDATEENNWTADTNDGFNVPSRMYSLSSVRAGRDEANPVILPGDIIVVQKAAPIYFTGEVRNPTGILLKEGGTSLTQAIAMVGGVNPQAKTKDIRIYRLKPNSKEREIITANYDLIKKNEEKDPMLEPYDIVEVDKSKKSFGQILFETVTGAARASIGGFGNVLPQRILY